jgi:hypothetical protein
MGKGLGRMGELGVDLAQGDFDPVSEPLLDRLAVALDGAWLPSSSAERLLAIARFTLQHPASRGDDLNASHT